MRGSYYVLTASLLWAHPGLAATNFNDLQARLRIPFAAASIVDASGQRPDVILIQDIHRHPQAQENIRTMILSAMASTGAKEIFLEGSWTHGQTADYSYMGIEDADTYKANVEAFDAVEKNREGAMQELETASLFGDAFDAPSADSLKRVKRLIQLRLKPAEYAEYLKSPFRASTRSQLADAVTAAEHFYEIANERSHIFLKNAKALHKEGPQVMVVGGFHTAAMTDELHRQGISYVVLSPHVSQGGFDGLYAQGMHDTISALKLH